MTHGKKRDITNPLKLGVPRKATKATGRRANVGLPPEVAARIDAFLTTATARKLGMKSRTDFVVRLTIAFLVNYDTQVEALERLYVLDYDKIKGATLSDLD